MSKRIESASLPYLNASIFQLFSTIKHNVNCRELEQLGLKKKPEIKWFEPANWSALRGTAKLPWISGCQSALTFAQVFEQISRLAWIGGRQGLAPQCDCAHC